jgi:hypothetical protein
MTPIQIVTHNDERYVWVKDLYKELELRPSNYASNLKAWFSKEYLFQGKKILTVPVKNYDYIHIDDIERQSSIKTPASIGQLLSDSVHSYPTRSEQGRRGKYAGNYLIRLEFAKLITLESSSSLKKQFVHWLLSVEAQLEGNQLLSKSTMFGLMEIVKLCTYIDNQLAYYKDHKANYFESKEPEDSWNEFDRWRNSVLGLLSEADLTEEYIKIKGVKPSKSLTKIEKLAILDALGRIRSSMFDFLSLQLQIKQARDLSDFVKVLFEKAGVTQFDMKPKGFSPNGQLDLFRGIQEIDVKLITQTLRELKPYSNERVP